MAETAADIGFLHCGWLISVQLSAQRLFSSTGVFIIVGAQPSINATYPITFDWSLTHPLTHCKSRLATNCSVNYVHLGKPPAAFPSSHFQIRIISYQSNWLCYLELDRHDIMPDGVWECLENRETERKKSLMETMESARTICLRSWYRCEQESARNSVKWLYYVEWNSKKQKKNTWIYS